LVLTLLLGLTALAAGPATVVEHTLKVSVNSSGALLEQEVWRIRVDDPAACMGGLPAPVGMDGVDGGGGRIREGVFIIPDNTQSGDVFTLRREAKDRGGRYSGEFGTAMGLDTETVHVVISAPSWMPLSLWADAKARPTVGAGGTRTWDVTWRDREGDDRGHLAWTTWKDWNEVSGAVSAKVSSHAASRSALNKTLGADLRGLPVENVVDRVNKAITLAPGITGSWTGVRRGTDVLASGIGTPAERALVMVAALRAAGHDVDPLLFSDESAGHLLPAHLPVPAAYEHPGVVVHTANGDVLIDPTADWATVPDKPLSMTGGRVWIPGDLPHWLHSPDYMWGGIDISGVLHVSASRTNRWEIEVVPRGTGLEAMRQMLGPMSADERERRVRELLLVARPGLQDVQIHMVGIGDPYEPFALTIEGSDTGTVHAFGDGLYDDIPAMLAPILAASLPPGLLVRERMLVNLPQGMVPLSASIPDAAQHLDARLHRGAVFEFDKVTLTTEVLRPLVAIDGVRDDRSARAFLINETKEGHRLTLFPVGDELKPGNIRGAENWSNIDIRCAEVLLWLSLDDDKSADKAMKRFLRAAGSPKRATDVLARFARQQDPRPWLSLWRVAASDEDRFVILEGMEGQGLRSWAWRLATSLASVPDPLVKAKALVVIAELQGPQPSIEDDPKGHAAWKDPSQLVRAANRMSRELEGSTVHGHKDMLLPYAEQLVRDFKQQLAEEVLETADGVMTSALIPILRAEVSAHSGGPVLNLSEQVHRAVHSDPFDTWVLGTSTRVLTRLGDHEAALGYALAAASLDPVNPARWQTAVDASLDTGDLPAAVYSAERQVQAQPGRRAFKEQLARLQQWRDTDHDVPGIISVSPERAHLAILRYHDVEVVSDADLLRQRGLLLTQAGLVDEAARDGWLLATRHRDADGSAIYFDNTAGRGWTSRPTAALNSAVGSSKRVRAARMEYRLITGDGDSVADAVQLRQQERAKALARFSSRPASVGETVGWNDELSDPDFAVPASFKRNRLLGNAPGVVAFSDPIRSMAIVVSADPDYELPPPLSPVFRKGFPRQLELDSGGNVHPVEGIAGLYAATEVVGELRIIGLGYSVATALQALEIALGQ